MLVKTITTISLFCRNKYLGSIGRIIVFKGQWHMIFSSFDISLFRTVYSVFSAVILSFFVFCSFIVFSSCSMEEAFLLSFENFFIES